MKKTIIKIFFYLFLLGVFVACHEVSHLVIAQSYGCEDIHIGFKWNVGIYVGIYVGANCTGDDVRLAQNISEAIFYNLGPLLFCLIVVMNEYFTWRIDNS